MDVSHVLDSLNANQREAVGAPCSNLLILAGAGSGKTRVLVHRIAWYISTGEASPHGILAVTFTNKAAAEMRSRIENLLGQSTRGMWVGTFHSLCHRLLRSHCQDANLSENFQILDNEDQYRTIRRTIRMMMLDESQYPPKEAQWYINAQKDKGLRPDDIKDDDVTIAQMVQVYKNYQETCERSAAVDFAELLLRTYELFKKNKSVREIYQKRFKHILVDELFEKVLVVMSPSTSLHLSVTSCYHPLPALQHPHTSQHSPSLWRGFLAYSFAKFCNIQQTI